MSGELRKIVEGHMRKAIHLWPNGCSERRFEVLCDIYCDFLKEIVVKDRDCLTYNSKVMNAAKSEVSRLN